MSIPPSFQTGEEDWEKESPAECKARHDCYAEIATEQEQAKAIAEPLESLENGIEFLQRFRRRFEKDDFLDSDTSDGSFDTDNVSTRGNHNNAFSGARSSHIGGQQDDQQGRSGLSTWKYQFSYDH